MDESRTEEYTYIVIGGGIAGVTCAEHLYILHPEAQTLVLTASALIKAVTNVLSLTKTLDSFEVVEHHPDILQSKCPSVRVLQDAVDHLDAKNQLVFTSSGRCFSYQQLCLCTGATPKLLSEGPHVLWLRDTESVLQFQSRIKDARRIMIVGNGGIATEMVYEVTDVEVVWAMKDKHMNAHFIDPGAAAFFHPEVVKKKVECPAPSKRRKYTIDHSKVSRNSVVGGALGPDWLAGLELKGKTERHIIMEHEVEVRKILEPEQVRELQATVTHLSCEEGEWPVYVELTNGKVYGCDFIVSAIGVTPNISAITTGNSFSLGEDGGLLIDEKMETTEKNVYAAGDVCSHGWPAAPHWFQMRLWTQARQMGSYAAKCLWSAQVGEETYLDFCFELFSHATKFFGQKVILLGLFNGQGLDGKYEILLRYTQGVEYIKCVMVEGRMQGAVLIGETDMEETFENLILNQMDLSVYGEDLLNPDVDIEDYFD